MIKQSNEQIVNQSKETIRQLEIKIKELQNDKKNNRVKNIKNSQRVSAYSINILKSEIVFNSRHCLFTLILITENDYLIFLSFFLFFIFWFKQQANCFNRMKGTG